MRVVIEIETDQFETAHQTPRAAAAQVAVILERLIHGPDAAPNGFITRGVVGGDFFPLLDANGTPVGTYSTRMEE